jgi:hypothetical protein
MAETKLSGFKYPFGEESCEHELQVLQEQYPKYYYNSGRFNNDVVNPDTYLIVGRRGAGKSSLAKYLEFQYEIKNARCIDVDEPDAYDETLREMAAHSSYSGDLLTSYLVKVWNYVIWSLIFDKYRHADPDIEAACFHTDRHTGYARFIADLLKQLTSRIIKDADHSLVDKLEDHISSARFSAAQKKVLKLTPGKPVIVAIDTLERYDKDDDKLMDMTAALIQCASHFNVAHAGRGIHVKIFIAAEIFPHIKEAAISNTTKFIRHPVYLHWRPRDLMHLLCWRFHRYLEHRRLLPKEAAGGVGWENFNEVIAKMWRPFFGEEISHNSIREKTFPHVLRHTQMRPRQLVVLCNAIAKNSLQSREFPRFNPKVIVRTIKETQVELANEVINSYARIYPRVGEILDALQTAPMLFDGSHLDRVAKKTAYAWPAGTYSMANFRKLAAELGIVGRVRSYDEKSRIVAADFEYALTDRLPLNSDDKCVIHPMFYTKLQTNLDQKLVVYPFPDHEDYADIHEY